MINSSTPLLKLCYSEIPRYLTLHFPRICPYQLFRQLVFPSSRETVYLCLYYCECFSETVELIFNISCLQTLSIKSIYSLTPLLKLCYSEIPRYLTLHFPRICPYRLFRTPVTCISNYFAFSRRVRNGNSEFCFPEALDFSRGEAEGNIEVEGEQNSLFSAGPVVKCFVIPPNSKPEKNCERNRLVSSLYSGRLTQVYHRLLFFFRSTRLRSR